MSQRRLMGALRALLIGADAAEQAALQALLAGSDIALDPVADYDAALAAVAQADYEAAVLGTACGPMLLRRVVAEGRLGPVLSLLAQADPAAMEAALSAGAADALPLPALTPLLLDRALRYTADRRRSDEVLRDMAMFDADTGLAKAELFWVVLSVAVRRAQRNRDHLAVLLLNAQPQPAGIELAEAEQRIVQRSLAHRLSSLLRSTDTVARFDNRHLVALVESMPRIDDIQVVAEKIIAEATSPIEVPGRAIALAVNVGISLYPAGATSPEGLIGNATRALARAQERGPNQFVFD